MKQPKSIMTWQAIVLVLFFAFYFYSIGAANLEAFLNYPFWREMGAEVSNETFVRLRQNHIWKVLPLLIAPIGGLCVTSFILAVFPPTFIPRWVFIGVFVCLVAAIISTLAIQLPIQNQHTSIGYDQVSFDRLIKTDLWLRKIPSLIEGVFVLIGLWLTVTKTRSPASRV